MIQVKPRLYDHARPNVANVRADNLLDGFLIAGSTAAAAGVTAGGYAVLRYGRRASVSITAEAHVVSSGFIVSTRPTVRAVGVFPVKFRATDGVVVRLTEVYVADGELVESEIASDSGHFGEGYADPGEELTTTVTFGPIHPPDSVIGWQAFLRVAAPTRLEKFRTWRWSDQVFIPRPVSLPV